MKLTLSFSSRCFYTWPKSQSKTFNILRMKRNTFSIIFDGLSVAKNDGTRAHCSRIFIQKYDHFVSFWYHWIFNNNILLSPENQINLVIITEAALFNSLANRSITFGISTNDTVLRIVIANLNKEHIIQMCI